MNMFRQRVPQSSHTFKSHWTTQKVDVQYTINLVQKGTINWVQKGWYKKPTKIHESGNTTTDSYQSAPTDSALSQNPHLKPISQLWGVIIVNKFWLLYL